MVQVFTTTTLARRLGVPLRKIVSMIERGYIKPSYQDANGHGSKRLWSITDADIACSILLLEPYLNVKMLRKWAAIAPNIAGEYPLYRLYNGMQLDQVRGFLMYAMAILVNDEN